MTSTIKSDRPTRTTVTSSLSSVTASSCVAYKEPSGACRADFYARASANIAQNAVLFTLPNGYRPSMSYGGVAIVITSGNVPIVGSATINTSGQILMPDLTSSGRSVMGHIEYYV